MTVFKSLMIALAVLFMTVGVVRAEDAAAPAAEHQVVEQAAEIATAAHHTGESLKELVHETGHSGLPQFNFATWPSQIFWLVVTFALLYVVFSKAVLPSIGSTLVSRKQHIDSHIADAEVITYKAQDLEAEVAKAMKDAAHKASDEVHAAENEAKERLGVALADFRTRYEQEIEAAESRIAEAKGEAMGEMQQVVAQLAADMASKVAGLDADAAQAESVVKSLSKNRQAA